MKQYKVKQDKHRFKPLQFGLYKNKIKLIYKVKFDKSCAYDLGDEDQADINKLFGLGFLSFDWTPHQVDSARFGWNYNRESNKINIYSYCYINKVPKYDYFKPICSCDLEKEYNFYLGVSSSNYHFVVFEKEDILDIGHESIPYNHSKKWTYLLTPYFGGNRTSPHNMIIYMEKD